MDVPGADKNKRIKKIATWIVMAVMLTVFIADIVSVALQSYMRLGMDKTDARIEALPDNADVIHFVPTANSDCVILESGGHYAMIDSGEGDENPRKPIKYEGYQSVVRDYLRRVAGDENGRIHLDFILGTHPHYDHIGNFEAIILDPDVTIDKAYFKPFPERTLDYETEIWKNDETYAAIMAALDERGFEVVHELPDSLTLGDMSIELYNTVTPEELIGKGLNHDSVGAKVSLDGHSVFLSADFTDELEQIWADRIGDVDLIKLCHHGYSGSTSLRLLKSLTPEAAVVTNLLGRIWPNVKWRINVLERFPVLAAPNSDGVAAVFTPDGLRIYTHTNAAPGAE